MTRTLTAAVLAATLAAAPTPLAHADDPFMMCPSGRSGIETTVTSCPFADNVRQAYINQGHGPMVDAYSPVTGQVYEMQCSPGFTAHFTSGESVGSVRCAGGNNAVVVIW